MRNWKITGLAAMTALALFALSGCGSVDETFLDTEANYTVAIDVPYATATPLPEYLNVPDAIVIDSDGNVTLNDPTVIEGDFQSALDQEAQTEYRSLSLGSTGIPVQALQARLKELGYYSSDVSGLFDPDTEVAVKRFEQTYGTMQTGVATAKLQLRLFAASAPVYGSEEYNQAVLAQYTVLRPGTVGSAVYALQQRLKNLGYPITDLTGVYDDQTAYCVGLFYQAYGIAPSDVADVNMQRELYSEDARAYDPTNQPAVTPPPDTSDPYITVPGEVDADDGGSAITMGNSGEQVAQIQRRLIELGYMAPGGDTGVYDEATRAAVNRFLQTIGREPTGMLTTDMQAFLMSDSAPRFGTSSTNTEYQNLGPGDSGEAVLNLQRRFVELHYANGTPNGQYGNATISAVMLYQQCNGMDVDGLASAWLQVTLFSDDALTYEETQGIDTTPVDETADDVADAFVDPDATAEPVQRAGDTLFFNLALGSTGNGVGELQNRLSQLGYSVNVTGTYDEMTRDAVMAFQNALCVEPTGEASAAMQRYLYSFAAPGPNVRFYKSKQSFNALAPGSMGEEVTNLQRQLYTLGYLSREDIEDSVGTYNEATRLAVASAQLAMGYTSADGYAGVEFQSFIFSAYAGKIKQ